MKRYQIFLVVICSLLCSHFTSAATLNSTLNVAATVGAAGCSTVNTSAINFGTFESTLFQENVLRQLFEANVFKLLVSEGLITAELIATMRTMERKHSGCGGRELLAPSGGPVIRSAVP